MRKFFLIIIFLGFENFLFANECNMETLNEKEKGKLYQIIEDRLDMGFKDFFIKNKIQLEQSKISFNIVNEYDSSFLKDTYRVDIFFTGKTKRSTFSNRPVEKYFEYKIGFNAYYINFSWTQGRDNEGIPYINYCEVWADSGMIHVYNTSYDNFLIGEFFPKGGLFERFEYPL